MPNASIAGSLQLITGFSKINGYMTWLRLRPEITILLPVIGQFYMTFYWLFKGVLKLSIEAAENGGSHHI